MKKILAIILALFLVFAFWVGCSIKEVKVFLGDYPDLPLMASFDETGIDYITDQRTAINTAKCVWKKELGNGPGLLTLYHARLVEDKYWVIEGVPVWQYMFRINGGGPYIILQKNGKVMYVGETG